MYKAVNASSALSHSLAKDTISALSSNDTGTHTEEHFSGNQFKNRLIYGISRNLTQWLLRVGGISHLSNLNFIRISTLNPSIIRNSIISTSLQVAKI